MGCDKCFYYEGKEDSYCYMFEKCSDIPEGFCYYEDSYCEEKDDREE